MINRLLYKFSLFIVFLFGPACVAVANDIPFFTVEHNEQFYAVSKQTAPLAFDSDHPVFSDYCQSLSKDRDWQLAQMTDISNFLITSSLSFLMEAIS